MMKGSVLNSTDEAKKNYLLETLDEFTFFIKGRYFDEKNFEENNNVLRELILSFIKFKQNNQEVSTIKQRTLYSEYIALPYIVYTLEQFKSYIEEHIDEFQFEGNILHQLIVSYKTFKKKEHTLVD